MYFIGLLSKLILTGLVGVATALPGNPTQPTSQVQLDPPEPVEAGVETVVPQPVEKPQYTSLYENGRVRLVGDASTCYVPLRKLLERKGITEPRAIRLEMHKSQRLLKLFVNGEMVKDYVVGMGGNPDQPKTRRGDSATPVGDYYVCQKLPNSSFYLSLKLSYPNIKDAHRGLSQGLINKATYNRIVNAINSRGVPPMNTRLGSDICIHGGGAGTVNWKSNPPSVKVRDWTAGCMAVANPEMKELFHFIPVGTPVKILP